jgi:hypothetical protein
VHHEEVFQVGTGYTAQGHGCLLSVQQHKWRNRTLVLPTILAKIPSTCGEILPCWPSPQSEM